MNFATREDAIEAISKCASQEELFDVANKALGSARQAWGDDFSSCAQLAYLWSTAAFPVAANNKVDLHYIGGEIKGVSGQALIDAGLRAAKVMATHLLSPCADQTQVNALLDLDLLQKLEPIAEDLTGRSNLSLSAVLVLCGSQTAIHSRSHKLVQAVVSASLHDWGDLDEHLAPAGVNAPWEDEEMDRIIASLDALPKAPDDIFVQMIQESGYSYLRCGPAGGMEQAKQMALGVFNASKDLADHVGIPRKDVGLDGIFCTVNALGGDAFASCDKIGRGITFGRPPGCFGHEWVHAMEDWVDTRSNIPSLREDLKRLRDDAIAPPQDRKACQDWLDRQKDGGLQETLSLFIEAKGNAKAKALMAHEGGVPALLNAQVAKDFAAKGTDRMIVERLVKTLDAWRDESAAPINAAALVYMVKEQKELPALMHRLTKMMAEGQSLFQMDAYERDNKSGGNYWTSEMERLARASEAHFATKGNPILGYVGKDDTSSPQGSEFEAVDDAFKHFGQQLSVAIENGALGPRGRIMDKMDLANRVRTRRGPDVVAPNACSTLSMG